MRFGDWLIRYVPQKILVFKLKNHLEACDHTPTSIIHCTVTTYKVTSILHFQTKYFGSGKAFIVLKKKIWIKGFNHREGAGGESFPLSLKFSLGKQTKPKPQKFINSDKNKTIFWPTPDNVAFVEMQPSANSEGIALGSLDQVSYGGLGFFVVVGFFFSLRGTVYYFNKSISTVTSPYLLEKIKELRSA